MDTNKEGSMSLSTNTLTDMLARAEADFREERVGYRVVELVRMREATIRRDFASGFYTDEDDTVTVKPPSGCEQELARPLVEAILTGSIR